MDASYKVQLQHAEQVPEWDLHAMRKLLVAAADGARLSLLSAEEEQKFLSLCQLFRERLQKFMPSM